MPSFGENLRREREMRGVTLEEIAAATKISVRFLEAIEAEEFNKLPGGIFTRSFLRTYAKYLGLDEERVLAEYQLVTGPVQEFDLARAAIRKSSAATQGSRTPMLALLVAAVLLAGGYGLFRYSRRATDALSNASRAPSVAPVPSVAAPPIALPSATALPSTAPSSAPSATPDAGGVSENPGQPLPPTPAPNSAPNAVSTAASGMLTLQVAATERSWVAVEADGKTVISRVLEPNTVETFQARETFAVTTGNAQGVILTLNGETLKPLGRHGEVKSLRLSRSDLKNSAP